MGWAQRRKDRVDRHREHLLAETREQLEIELSSFSARGASPVSCDAELDSPASLAVQDQDFPDAPVVQEACGQDFLVVRDAHDRKRRRHVAVQDYPWKFVSPQLLDRDGREILYPVEDDRDRWSPGRVRWSAQSIIIATWRSATWTVYKPILWKL